MMASMKKPLAVIAPLLLAALTGGLAAADQRHQSTAYWPASINVPCSVNAVCDIRLPAGEVMTNVEIQPKERWYVTPRRTSQADDAISVVFVSPRYAPAKGDDSAATLTITSRSNRFYYAFLHSVKQQTPTTAVWGFAPTPRPRPTVEAALQGLPTLAAPSAAPAPTAIPEPPRDFDYSWTCGAPYSPLAVYNDGLHTHIVFAGDPTEVPVVIGDALSPVNSGSEPLGLVLDGVPRTFYLRVGADKGDVSVQVSRGRNTVKKGCHAGN